MKKFYFLIMISSFLLTSCISKQQKITDSMSTQLQVYYRVADNHAGQDGVNGAQMGADWASVFKAVISIHNSGEELMQKDWSIFFSSIRRILATENDQFTIQHITGDLHALRPTDKFTGFAAGSQTEIPIIGEYWQLFESDVLPRWYLVLKGATPRIIQNTNTENLESFVYPITGDNWKRTPEDKNILMTVQNRFKANENTTQLPLATLRERIVPTPLSAESYNQNIDLSQGIVFDSDSPIEEKTLSVIKDRLKLFSIPTDGAVTEKAYHIKLHMIPEMFDSGMQISGAYQLHLNADNGELTGFDEVGIFYGLQSLLALIDIHDDDYMIPAVGIYDAPRFDHRGMHLDIARNFHSKAAILRLLDQMASYKLNKFHLHLSDDEGWRLEIPGLPELTSFSAQRGYEEQEVNYLLTQLGSGPFITNPANGYLSRQDYIEILQYAKARHIEVIPEVDMPGHARAAVMAMEKRYQKYMKRGKKNLANQYRLMDPEDDSRVTTVQLYDRHSFINPALPSSINFVDKIVGEIAAMHQEAGMPLLTWHYGGDEAKNILLGSGFQDINANPKEPDKGIIDQSRQDMPFAKSPAAQQLLKDGLINDISELPSYFAKEVSKVLAKHGVPKMLAWQDGLDHLENAQDLAVQESGVNLWDTLYWGAYASAPKWTQKGFSVIISSPDYFYFDMPYEVNPKEYGYYWATRFTDEKKIYSFSPNNLPQNAETSVDRDGQYFSAKGVEPWPGPYGMQGQLWSEIVRTDEQMEYMIYPRLLALAERAWHKAEWESAYVLDREYVGGRTNYVNQQLLNKNWQDFANLIAQKELPKLDKAGIQYRLPVPGARIQNGMLEMNISLPGLPMEYSKDAGATWQVYREPIPVDGAVFVRSTSWDKSRTSRVEEISFP